MLSTRTQRTVMTQKDLDELNKIIEDRTGVSAYDIAWYGVTDDQGYGKRERDALLVKTDPVDHRTKGVKIDRSKDPERD